MLAVGQVPSDHGHGEIDPSVRALSILATSGVEVHLMNLPVSNGRLFLDVNAVGPRSLGMPRVNCGSVVRRIRDCRDRPPPGRARGACRLEECEAAAEENLDAMQPRRSQSRPFLRSPMRMLRRMRQRR